MDTERKTLGYMHSPFTNVCGPPTGWYGSLANLGRACDRWYSFDEREVRLESFGRSDLTPVATHARFFRKQCWTLTEIVTFVDRYLQFPKDFVRIRGSTIQKTRKQCVDFYYR